MSPRSKSVKLPWLLYSYPWMPFPRRVSGYLSEKQIPSSVVRIVHVSDPQAGNSVIESQAAGVPPRPEGSLPILAIPPKEMGGSWSYIRQSMAIIAYLEEATAPGGELSHIMTRTLCTGKTALERARMIELQTLGEEVLVEWNPVRTFGTKAGTMVYPEGSREMLRWVHRGLATIDKLLGERDLSIIRRDTAETVSVADIVLFHSLDFTDVCYGVDLTKGSGQMKTDVYGRTVKEEYGNLATFYKNFQQRQSARRRVEDGEMPGKLPLEFMSTWHDGIL